MRAATKRTPRGIRINNPGNIRHGRSEWKGMAADQTVDAEFVHFEEPVWGLRAIVRILRNYYDRYGLRSVKAMIQRYAPPNENDTGAYIKTVADRIGVGPEDDVDIDDLATLVELVRAIVRVECAAGPLDGERWFEDDLVIEAIRIA